jgi:hypothetical protein
MSGLTKPKSAIKHRGGSDESHRRMGEAIGVICDEAALDRGYGLVHRRRSARADSGALGHLFWRLAQ